MITLEQIATELASIYDYLQQKYNEKSGDQLSNRITKLNASLARSAELLSDAKYYLDEKKGRVAEEIYLNEEFGHLSSTQSKSIIEGRVALEYRIYFQCERLNRSITHQLEGLRTQISYLKSISGV